jgi:hypothetical protein
MTGIKYKLAHKRAGKLNWNTNDNQQRKQLIQILEDLIVEVKSELIEDAK